MKLNPKTNVISAKEVARIMRRTDRFAYRLLSTIRKKEGKQRHHFVTIAEFCIHTGLKIEDVLPELI